MFIGGLRMNHPIHQWAQQYGVSQEAFAALLNILGAGVPEFSAVQGLKSEAGVQQQVRLASARRGDQLLFRNNSGACEDKDGRLVRYGLANDSKQMNEKIKSSDLIGITRVTCRCGWIHGVFTAYEVKKGDWVFRESDKRAVAQLNFIQKIIAMGGIARFVTKAEDIL